MNYLLYIGIILVSGLVFGKLVSYLKLPRVTGYLIAGILIGPSILGIVPRDTVSNLGVVSDVALGIISFGIGSELNFSNLKRLGSKIIIITMFEAFAAVLVVDLILIFVFKQDVAFSMILGAIAAATAPASTIMVLKQYKAKGPLVDTLLPVVAIDDIMAVVALGVSLALTKNIVCVAINEITSVAFLGPFLEMAQAILIGILLGVMLSILCRNRSNKEDILSITIAMVFLAIGVSTLLNISTLLTSIALGATISNLATNKSTLFESIDSISAPIFLAFFTLAGAELELGLLSSIGVIGIVYIVSRIVGKVMGASIGSKITGAEKNVQKYLGMTLLPQAGVAIGLVVVASTALPEYGQSIRAIVLSATVVYELIGPYLTKIAIFKAGEVNT